ncbi:hypothetical protein [Pseudomonas sp. GM30]|uniref:hypothetical protein n=1 Tax=Pseudomonas sp. GM30 TaxID=1144328 RepID=UPI000270462C|nr:hypothetical protein [Pseudomonas sp. GM30]EUB85289.1 hypothetical protein PMI25_000774 [Pseudomonas sp. GM30]
MNYDQWREWFGAADLWAKQSNILLPILLSVIAAIIFWWVFSYQPEQKRRKKLRPIIELTLFETYKKLFSLFDLIMAHNLHSPSFFQAKIRSGNLSEDDIKLGLQNKCLNETYLYDLRTRDALLVVGEDILDRSMNIDELCNKVLVFHTYATAEELVLLESIREKIRIYHFSERHIKKDCEVNIGGQILRPFDPSLSYRRRNFYEIYKLFSLLQALVLNHHELDRDRFIYKIQWLYYSGQYHLCAKFIRAHERSFERDLTLFRNYLALSERKKGNIKVFYKLIEDTFKTRPHGGGALISSRSTFKELLEDNKLFEILSQYYSADEISSLRHAVIQDSEDKERFESANQLLANYYREKVVSSSTA